jgi:predicted AlkP superfamily phosphohydrolase/phosphomutase
MAKVRPKKKLNPNSPDWHKPADPAKRENLKKLAALGMLAMLDFGVFGGCGRRTMSSSQRKVIVVGLDGLDANYITRLLGEGKLPNMSRLQQMGGFRALTSSIPPESPVAWASFITGTDPGGSNIFDFIHRDPENYFPYLSIARSEGATKTLGLGKWELPLAGGKVESLRTGRPFWEVLNDQGIPASAYRVPTNFPPPPSATKQLAGLGAPDLRGSYGESSYFTNDPGEMNKEISGGKIYPVHIAKGRVASRLIGPENSLRKAEKNSSGEEVKPDTYVDFEVWLDQAHKLGKIVIQGQEILLRQGEWSGWVPLSFELIPHVKSVAGIVRFFLKEVSPHFKLYVSPINVDPVDPALPIAVPDNFSQELAEKFGRFYTQGFPHDVKALRNGVLSDEEYLQQSGLAFGEEKEMYEAALHDFSEGLLFYYFATTDRTQHMFWRLIDPKHPAYDAKLARAVGPVMQECYLAADKLVGQAMSVLDDKTTLIVMSDHGFGPYYRSFNLNTWLARNGYLAGVNKWGADDDIFYNADWQNSAAYGVGFNALYLNLSGREKEGSIPPDSRRDLLARLAKELPEVRDPDNGQRIIEKVYLGEQVYTNPDPARAPDLVIGYARGYRCSDTSVLGGVTEKLVEDNLDKWSGDHCIDRSAVPGILFSNKPIAAENPALPDVTAGILAEFEVPKPAAMTGKSIW